jgi:hypothetical protein
MPNNNKYKNRCVLVRKQRIGYMTLILNSLTIDNSGKKLSKTVRVSLDVAVLTFIKTTKDLWPNRYIIIHSYCDKYFDKKKKKYLYN